MPSSVTYIVWDDDDDYLKEVKYLFLDLGIWFWFLRVINDDDDVRMGFVNNLHLISAVMGYFVYEPGW